MVSWAVKVGLVFLPKLVVTVILSDSAGSSLWAVEAQGLESQAAARLLSACEAG